MVAIGILRKVKPKTPPTNKQFYLANKFFRMRGTGRRFVVVIAFRSTGQVGCRDSHSVMQALQNACSHTAACNGSSKTPAHIGQTSSSSTSPWNRVNS